MPDQPAAREAVIFVPGIGTATCDQSVDGIAQRITLALDHDTEDPRVRYEVEVREEKVVGVPSKICTVVRHSPAVPDGADGQAKPPVRAEVLDVYALQYSDTLTAAYQRSNLLVRMLLAVAMIVMCVPGLFWAFVWNKRTAKTPRQKFQFLFALTILAVMIAYVALLLWTGAELAVHGLDAARRALADKQQPTATVTQQRPAAAETAKLPESLGWRVRMLIVLAAFGVIVPANWRDRISGAAVGYFCILAYLRAGSRIQDVNGMVHKLLAHLQEDERVTYSRTHVIGYSFGAFVAIDSLFPYSGFQIERCKSVTTVVTIGHPFDLARTYLGKVVDCPRPRPPHRPHWLNIYCPLDLLGSNFRDDDKDDRPNHGPPLVPAGVADGVTVKPADAMLIPHENLMYNPYSRRQLHLLDILLLVGMKSHFSYWGNDPIGEENCFTPLVRKLFDVDGSVVMRGPRPAP